MKSYGQQKRKRVEVSRKQDECMGVNVKKSANGTCQSPRRATESIRTPHLEPPIQLQIPSAKIKLQLFPINDQTRRGLEKDGYNPFLELTLSARKRISSVIRHLNAKWGRSSTVIGQLVLFPYNTMLEQLASCIRWTSNDNAIIAWEVYVDVGSPSIFRLRYGWFSNHQEEMLGIPPTSSLPEIYTGSECRRSWPRILETPNHQEEQINESCETIESQINVNEALHSDVSDVKASKDDEATTEFDRVHSTVPWDDNLTNLSIGGLLSEISLQGKFNGSDPNSLNKSALQPVGLISDMSIGHLLSEASLLGKMSNPSMKLEYDPSPQPIFLPSSDVSIGGLFSEASLLSSKNKLDTPTIEAGHAQTQTPWDDTFTNLSIGGLLSEASLQAKADGNPGLKEANPSLHEPSLSILDAEETCHAFPIQKLKPSGDARTSNVTVSSK